MKKKLSLGLAFFCFWCAIAKAEDAALAPKKSLGGFMDFNAYYDTRDFSVVTINLLGNLPARFQYFSLTNFSNPVSTSTNLDLEAYYTEHHLRWFLPKELPIALTTQWVSVSGTNNEIARFGFLWQVSNTVWLKDFFEKIHMFYFINFHPLQIDSVPGTGWEIEHVYNIDIFPSVFGNRVYLGGFADHDMNYGAGSNQNQWVTEHQLGVRLIDWLHAVVEFKRNEYFATDRTGLGLGLEYKIVF